MCSIKLLLGKGILTISGRIHQTKVFPIIQLFRFWMKNCEIRIKFNISEVKGTFLTKWNFVCIKKHGNDSF